MTKYIVSVGSNIEPEINIHNAFVQIQLIDSNAQCASLIHTKAQGDTSQPDFINTAFLISCELDQTQLKNQLLKIESDLGRVRSENKNAAREIDLDITQIDGEIVDEDYQKYAFVKASVDELNQANSFNNLLETIQKFEQVIENQLKPLDVNYKQVLLLLSIQKNEFKTGDNDHGAIQYLIANSWIVQNNSVYTISDSGKSLLNTALKKLESFENRLFINQKMQHSLLAQLNKLYGF